MSHYLLDIHPKFSNKVIGHTKILEKLIYSYKFNKLHHAYILHGVKGIGKATLAYVFSKLILSQNNIDNSYTINNSVFNQNINLINKNCHPNLLVIEPEWEEKNNKYKNIITIEQTRQIKSFLTSTSLTNNQLKIVIIDAIDNLNLNAANSILKILEEPTSNRLFLLICHNLNNIIPTIKSRAIINNFSPLNKEQINEIIKLLRPSFTNNQLFLEEEIIKFTTSIEEGSLEAYLWFLNNDNLNIYKLLQDILINKNISNIYLLSDKIKNFSTYNLQFLLELIIKSENIINNYQITSKLSNLKDLLVQDKNFNLDKSSIITSYIIDLIYEN